MDISLSHKKLKYPAFLDTEIKPFAHFKEKQAKKVEEAEQALELEKDPLARFDRLIAERKLKEALPELEQIILKEPLSIPLNILMHSLLLQNKEYKQLAIHTKKFLNLLVGKKKYNMAAEVYYDCRVLDAKCKPIEPLQYYPLAKALCDEHRYKTAISLVKGFHRDFPNHTETPRIYLLVGRIYLEKLGIKDKAKHVLGFVIKHYPEFYEIKTVKKYYKEACR